MFLIFLFISFVQASRYDSVDCTVLLDDPVINRASIKNVGACLTSLTPYTTLTEESYCTAILSNNTEPINMQTTLYNNDETECLVMATATTFDTEFCNVKFYDCLSTSFDFVKDCSINIDCRPNRPPITINTIPISTITTSTSITTTTLSTNTLIQTMSDIIITETTQPCTTIMETVTLFETVTLNVPTTKTTTETTTETITSNSNKCCWDNQCMWYAQPNEWCGKSESRCIGCGGFWF